MSTVKANVIKGSDRDLIVRVKVKETDEPFDLSSASEIIAYFRKSDDTFLERKLSLSQIEIINACAGKLKIILDDASTSLLHVGDDQDFEIEIQIGTVTSIVQFLESLNVIDRVISSDSQC